MSFLDEKNFSSFKEFEKYILDELAGTGIDAASAQREVISHSLDTVWLIVTASLVFFMQAGFSLLEAGSVSMKNTKNILLKNMLDACLGAISFWLFGYAFAFGRTSNGFIGYTGFALAELDDDIEVGSESRLYDGKAYALFLFQFSFAAAAATIVSGAVAERCRLVAYFVYSIVLTAFVYPVVVHWGWSNGWASAFVEREARFLGVGVIDFAGSTVVHVVGGLTALIGAVLLGPRQGRFEKKAGLPQQSLTFQTLGVLFLWFGWFGFNCGSTLTVDGQYGDVAGKVAATTTICAATSALVATILGRIVDGHINLSRTNNGVLAGLVSICAGTSTVEPELAFVIGIVGAMVYVGSSRALVYLKVDDVVDAAPVHFFCGIWGTLAAGLFAHPDNVEVAYGTGSCGLFYKCEASGGKQFVVNIVFVLAVIAWTGACALLIFGSLKILDLLRVDPETERKGLDAVEHGGPAYELQTPADLDTSRAAVVDELEKRNGKPVLVSSTSTTGAAVNGKSPPSAQPQRQLSATTMTTVISST